MELDTVVSGSAGKRRRNNEDNRNDRNSKRSAVMRVYKAGEGSGSDLGAGGSGNGASKWVAVKWNTTGEWRALERVRERRAIWGAAGR
jgi:hypothetical protein